MSGSRTFLGGLPTAIGTVGAPNPGRFVGVTTSGSPTVGTYAIGDFCLTQNGQMFVCVAAGTPGTWITPSDVRNLVTSGEETLARDLCSLANLATTSQALRLTYFTCRKSETTTQVRIASGGTAAGATPTLVRIGLYLINAVGDGTLVASTANDTTLFATTNTGYTRSWSAPYAKVAGQRYSLGVLMVTATTTPTFVGTLAAGSTATESALAPRLSAVLTSQSDLPANFTSASLTNSGQRFYGLILP